MDDRDPDSERRLAWASDADRDHDEDAEDERLARLYAREAPRESDNESLSLFDYTIKFNDTFAMAGQVVADAFAKLAAALPDPAALREARRREIDAVLREDARRCPAFATARRCAVMAWVEAFDMAFGPFHAEGSAEGAGAERLLSALHVYEQHRGGAREPRPDANWHAGVNVLWLNVYERTRGLP